jgi:hypothetical protein
MTAAASCRWLIARNASRVKQSVYEQAVHGARLAGERTQPDAQPAEVDPDRLARWRLGHAERSPWAAPKPRSACAKRWSKP